VRRGIRKAQKSGLAVQFSTNEEAMRDFYVLHGATRRRHGLPPQPYRFFENITRHVLARGLGFIASISIASEPVAAAVFFHNKSRAIYKFGASDFAFQQLRPNNLLMWEAIRHCAGLGIETLHFGRTSFGNEGLRRFKLGFGAREERIDYFKYDFGTRSFVTDTDRVEGWHNRVFRCMPGPLLRLAGRFLYPHLS
jgi:lipid II:glycine glycyltransferase (peptidoglycan interpeptide bridge formation enzyme)